MEARSFRQRLLATFEERDLLRKRSSAKGRPWQLGILDGSCMGGHWLVTLCLAGVLTYPVMVKRSVSQGKEQAVPHKLTWDQGDVAAT